MLIRIRRHLNKDERKTESVVILQHTLKVESFSGRRFRGDKLITPTGINEMHALGDYAKEMYDLHQNI